MTVSSSIVVDGDLNVSDKEFFDAIFGDNLPNDEIILVSRQTTLGKGFFNTNPDDVSFSRSLSGSKPAAWYFNVSTVIKQDPLRRRKADCRCAYIIVCDDIGDPDKVDQLPPLDPSYKMETSFGSFQWGYILSVPVEDLDLYDYVVKQLGQLGFTDKGAGGYNRLFRVVGSNNIKPGRDNFASRLAEWNPTRMYTIEEIAAAFGIDLTAPRSAPSVVNQMVTGADVGEASIDPFYDWLADNGQVVEDDGSDWVKILCPNAEQHTTGENTMGYSPLGRGDETWRTRRSAKCQHAHCQHLNFRTLNDHHVEAGAPKKSGNDPLPWLQARYLFVVEGKKVVDTVTRLEPGGNYVMDFEEFKAMYYVRLYHDGADRPVLAANAFLADEQTTKVRGMRYDPSQADIALPMHGSDMNVNTYIPPTHKPTEEEPEVFLDHLEFLIEDDAELETFLDWLAFKIQNPGERSYAVVMVADEAYGTGRSWLGDALERVLQGKVNRASLAQLIGKGTAAQANYNDWAVGCQFLVVDEAKDVNKEDFYHGYEAFKQIVDTRPVPLRVNPKYGKTFDDMIFFNALIFSNHSDAIVLPPNDRRVMVIANPSKRETPEYYRKLHKALVEGEAARIFWYLKRRNISKYDPVYPPMTTAKQAMIEQTKSPSDEVIAHVMNSTGDIVTRSGLYLRVVVASRELEFRDVLPSTAIEGITSRVWKKLGGLKPSDLKNGYRMHINGPKEEVRAIRRKDYWMEQALNRAREVFLKELKRKQDEDEMTENVVDFRPKDD